jgi:hypothetical protein
MEERVDKDRPHNQEPDPVRKWQQKIEEFEFPGFAGFLQLD